MDDTAALLLQELSSTLPGNQPHPAAAAGALQPDDLDRQRILLVETAYLLNACFRDVQYWEGVKAEKDTFKQLAAVLLQLARLPCHDGTLSISRRSGAGAKAGDRPDYALRLGDLGIDAAIVAAVIKRMGIRFKHLEGRVLKFNETLAAEGIETLRLRLPDDSPDKMESLRVALRVLSCYRQAAEKNAPISFVRAGTPVQLTPVKDERHLPDPNLTMLAAVNDLSAAAVQELVSKVSALMKRPEGAALGRRTPNLFQALFAIKSLREKLQRPPIEVNADLTSGEAATAPMAAPYSEGHPAAAVGAAGAEPASAVSGGSVDPATAGGTAPAAAAPVDDRALMAGMQRFIASALPGGGAATVQAVRGVFAQDYGSIGADLLGQRLGQMSQLLSAMQANPSGAKLIETVLQRVQAGMDQLPPELLNDVVVEKNELKVWEGGRERVVGRVEENLAQAIDTAKNHAAARRHLQSASGAEPIYLSREPQALAAFFDLPLPDMEAILSLFRSCFDSRGSFQKPLFEKRVPELAKYHKKIFAVLWEFLKEMPRRADRVPFLNSIQLMIKEIRQPLQAVRTLLSDFTGDPAQVRYSDRNALMLSTQFLRTYNKEINVDIELTPEEILRVYAGLDAKVVSYAGWKVNGEQKRFLTKAVGIRKRIMAALDPGLAGTAAMPLKFLLALEREFHIFLALLGGRTAESILHSALGVYGSPESPFYGAEEGRRNYYGLLQHLSVLIRGVGRIGGEVDLILIDRVRSQEKEFLKMAADPRQASMVRRVFIWAEPARKEIEFRLKGGTPGAAPSKGRSNLLSSTNTLDF